MIIFSSLELLPQVCFKHLQLGELESICKLFLKINTTAIQKLQEHRFST
jgi:hypothetical protein